MPCKYHAVPPVTDRRARGLSRSGRPRDCGTASPCIVIAADVNLAVRRRRPVPPGRGTCDRAQATAPCPRNAPFRRGRDDHKHHRAAPTRLRAPDERPLQQLCALFLRGNCAPPWVRLEVFVTVGERSGMWLSRMVCGWRSLMVMGG